MTSFYFAASFDRGEELAPLAEFVQAFGHTVTSSWLAKAVGNYEADEVAKGRTVEEVRIECSQQDLADIDAADVLVSFTESTRDRYFSGGRHVEFGYAVASGKGLIVVGPLENIFHHLPGICHFETIDIFRAWIATLTMRFPAARDFTPVNPYQGEPYVGVGTNAIEAATTAK